MKLDGDEIRQHVIEHLIFAALYFAFVLYFLRPGSRASVASERIADGVSSTVNTAALA